MAVYTSPESSLNYSSARLASFHKMEDGERGLYTIFREMSCVQWGVAVGL